MTRIKSRNTWLKIRRGTSPSNHSDMIRGLAAIAVLYSHARVLLVASSDGSTHLPLVARLLYILSNYGHTAVILFFLLSGSLVGGSVVQMINENRWSWRKYLLARGVRLYIVLLPALLLTCLWDKWGLALSAVALTNQDTAKAIITPAQVHAHSGWGILIGNIAFLQTISVPTYGSNSALWSLANEFWYYLIFPCLWLGVAGRLPTYRRVVYGFLGIVMLVFAGRSIAAYFPFWLMGVLAMADIPCFRTWAQKAWFIAASCLGFTFVLLLIGLGKIPFGQQANLAAAVSFFLVLVFILRRQTKPNLLYGRLAGMLAGCSFTLYAIHLPILVFLRARFTLTQAWSPQPQTWVWVGFICAAIFVFAYALSQVTEAQTENVKSLLARRKPSPHSAMS